MRRRGEHRGVPIDAREAALAIPDGRRKEVSRPLRPSRPTKVALPRADVLGRRLAERGAEASTSSRSSAIWKARPSAWPKSASAARSAGGAPPSTAPISQEAAISAPVFMACRRRISASSSAWSSPPAGRASGRLPCRRARRRAPGSATSSIRTPASGCVSGPSQDVEGERLQRVAGEDRGGLVEGLVHGRGRRGGGRRRPCRQVVVDQRIAVQAFDRRGGEHANPAGSTPKSRAAFDEQEGPEPLAAGSTAWRIAATRRGGDESRRPAGASASDAASAPSTSAAASASRGRSSGSSEDGIGVVACEPGVLRETAKSGGSDGGKRRSVKQRARIGGRTRRGELARPARALRAFFVIALLAAVPLVLLPLYAVVDPPVTTVMLWKRLGGAPDREELDRPRRHLAASRARRPRFGGRALLRASRHRLGGGAERARRRGRPLARREHHHHADGEEPLPVDGARAGSARRSRRRSRSMPSSSCRSGGSWRST